MMPVAGIFLEREASESQTERSFSIVPFGDGFRIADAMLFVTEGMCTSVSAKFVTSLLCVSVLLVYFSKQNSV
jgi:hypothetical protein